MQDASDIITDVIDGDLGALTAPSTESRVSAFVSESADQIVRTAREHPKTAIAAGAAVVVGAIAAAAIPAIRASKAKTTRKVPAAKRPATRKAATAKPAATKKTN